MEKRVTEDPKNDQISTFLVESVSIKPQET